MFRKLLALVCLAALAFPAIAVAESGKAPWGQASSKSIDYSGQEVVFDVAVDNKDRMNAVLDRASFISQLSGANPFDTSIVLVLHGEEIPYFAIENFAENEKLMRRAHNLTMNDTIEFRMCEQAASFHDYKPSDIHGFVTLVPMAEAEIVRYQKKGYAYLSFR